MSTQFVLVKNQLRIPLVNKQQNVKTQDWLATTWIGVSKKATTIAGRRLEEGFASIRADSHWWYFFSLSFLMWSLRLKVWALDNNQYIGIITKKIVF